MDSGFLGRVLDADLQARNRELESRIDIDALNREWAKAQQRGLRVVPLAEKNRAGFVQVIAPNMRYIMQHRYMSSAEAAFLLALSAYAEMHSNAIIAHDGGSSYLKVAGMADRLGYSRQQASRLVNALVSKGLIYEYDTLTIKKHGRVIEERPLFLNPEIIFCGDRNRVNATLCRLVMNADHMERSGVRLPWKLWLGSGAEYGRLYRRDTWLKKKKQR
jgi:hypothetical protein